MDLATQTLTVTTLAQSIDMLILHAGNETGNQTIQHVVASDLMSDVLVVSREDFLLVTSLSSEQMIRTADLVGAVGVVLVNGKHPPDSVVELARELGITLASSTLPKYEFCIAVHTAMNPTG